MKRTASRKAKAKLPSLSALARLTNPFDEPDVLLKRLRVETTESKHLEWKITPPFGPGVTVRTKCRMTKALISFANTDGGFVVFGIDQHGKWVGFLEEEVKATDPAMIAELVNGCVNPELSGLNYGLLREGPRLFPVLHVPPSPAMPHVTTKELGERLPDGKQVTHIQRHAVYCRYSAKSDLATAAQYSRIITQRTEMLRSEMLRRVKEVSVPTLVSATGTGSGQKTILRVSQGKGDKTIATIRITRDAAESAGIVMHEEISEGLFEEINNVLETNRLLAVGERGFVLGDEIYYRVYAERRHVQSSAATFELLSRTALERIYAPSFFWLLRLQPSAIAKLVRAVLAHPRSTQVRLVCRLAVLLGRAASDWLMANFEQQWKSHPQPPPHFFAFKKMMKLLDSRDLRLVALQLSASSKIELGEDAASVELTELLGNPQQAANLLSKACMAVFRGKSDLRSGCRQLDVLAYGSELLKIGGDVTNELSSS